MAAAQSAVRVLMLWLLLAFIAVLCFHSGLWGGRSTFSGRDLELSARLARASAQLGPREDMRAPELEPVRDKHAPGPGDLTLPSIPRNWLPRGDMGLVTGGNPSQPVLRLAFNPSALPRAPPFVVAIA